MALNYTERWDALGRGDVISTPDVSNATKQRQFYNPLSHAADDFVHWAQNPNERIYIGLISTGFSKSILFAQSTEAPKLK